MKILYTTLIFIAFFFSIAFSNDEQQDSLQKENNIFQNDVNPDDIKFDNDSLYQIVMLNDNKYIGKILSQDEKEIELMTDNMGEVTLSKEFIKSITQIHYKDIHKGSYWFPNPNATRNLFSPTGYGLKAGEGYYQNIYALFNFITLGITDFFSIGFGTELLSLSLWHPIFIANPKFSFELDEEWHLGLSSMLFIANWSINVNVLGIHHGVLTYGSRDNNISVGGGIFTVQGNEPSGVVTISGMLRLSEGTALVSENWVSSSDFSDIPYSTIFSYAVRLMGETYSFDLGFINNAQIAPNFFLGIPYVDFIIRW
jgi:hypothetical protein